MIEKKNNRNKIANQPLRKPAVKEKAPKEQISKNQMAKSLCPYYKKCGSCQLLHYTYKEQLAWKQKKIKKLLGKYCTVHPIIGMEDPWHYRNKVHAVMDRDKKGKVISGIYEEKSHRVVAIDECLIEDKIADQIIATIRNMTKSFKITIYDEDTGYGLLRHILIRRGFKSGQIMVVLVTASPVFPSKNNFTKALLKAHPEITTVVQNINPRGTSMVLGGRNVVMYGKGYIEDELCGNIFRISPNSFYQVNSVQAEKLYKLALKQADLKGTEKLLDAYCGIGTIGITASRYVKEVIGVELNGDAVKDAIANAKRNKINNVRFYQGDAGEFMQRMVAAGETLDVVIMDPPRTGSSEAFINAVKTIRPKKVIYISCGPDTQARDLELLKKVGYQAEGCWPVDLFPGTEHIETVCLLSKKCPV